MDPIQQAELELDMLRRRREQKQAERKARWDHYREQLAKATPFQYTGGGSSHRTGRGRRFIRYD